MKIWLFDFDGTLVDSMPTYVSLMLRILDENDIVYGNDIVKTITPLGYKGTAEHFVKMGMDMPVEKIMGKMHEYASYEYANNVPAKANVEEALRALKARGDRLNVLTASPHAMLDPCLKRLGLYELFDNVWSCDDFDTTKANPEIYRMVAEKLDTGVGEYLFVDDNLNAVRTAKCAGVPSFGIYDKSGEEFKRELCEVADGYLMTLSDLLT